jgi:RNA polymerase sigma-70 factor (ECF subfamily)
VSETERALVERAQKGDQEAFGLLYQRYVDRILTYLLFTVGDRDLAEDLTQDVFVQMIRRLEGFEWRGSLAPWIMRIARNAVVDHWRRRQRRPERTQSAVEAGSEGLGEESLLERLAVVEESEVFGSAEAVLDRERIIRAAAGLTDLQQQVLALRFGVGLNLQETAETMGRSEGAIKNLQHHAVRALRRGLDEQARSARTSCGRGPER